MLLVRIAIVAVTVSAQSGVVWAQPGTPLTDAEKKIAPRVNCAHWTKNPNNTWTASASDPYFGGNTVRRRDIVRGGADLWVVIEKTCGGKGLKKRTKLKREAAEQG